jgi:translation initiation factor 5
LTPVEDPWYRYTMPAVVGNKIERSGSTVLPNITDVAQSLHRSPGEVTKFFGIELGARAGYDPDTDRAVVAGRHADGVLQHLVRRYIEKFVLCPRCGLPETAYKIKSAAVYHVCRACGAEEMVDMSHKLCNYILAENTKDKASGEAAAKKSRNGDKKKSKTKEKDGSNNDEKKNKDNKDDKTKPSYFSSKRKNKSEGTS